MVTLHIQRGFTLIELMATVAVLGILLAIGIPSFTDLLNRKRLESVGNNTLSLIAYAKSEALKRNVDVTLLMTRTSASDWRIRAALPAPAADADGICDADTPCDLRTMAAAEVPSVQLAELSTQFNNTVLDPIRLLPAFPDGTSTARGLTYEIGRYQLRAEMTITGLTRLCIPEGKPGFGGYPAC
ncbi:Tfp pilus assembly protein FimT/FimU [Jeongeupia sp. USM3]|uniref:pilus assembly FimT family protein n=1 Tax=Jeongeupia sp. USM3 TaxID=1906741 RepID=UPI00089DD733|nr:GspH/FimT family pseudopilin [Jeongeupia sp. USM3]AOX99657.1 hypothetical protein BJP62_03820 [Jeongeupia sp. USM3]